MMKGNKMTEKKKTYAIEKDIPIGEFSPTEPNHPMWKIAKEMQVGDCVTFKRRNPDEMNDMKLLKMYLHKLYGKVYLKRAVRPWTQSSNFTQSRVWRVSADEKIENIRKWFAKQGLNSDEL